MGEKIPTSLAGPRPPTPDEEQIAAANKEEGAKILGEITGIRNVLDESGFGNAYDKNIVVRAKAAYVELFRSAEHLIGNKDLTDTEIQTELRKLEQLHHELNSLKEDLETQVENLGIEIGDDPDAATETFDLKVEDGSDRPTSPDQVVELSPTDKDNAYWQEIALEYLNGSAFLDDDGQLMSPEEIISNARLALKDAGCVDAENSQLKRYFQHRLDSFRDRLKKLEREYISLGDHDIDYDERKRRHDKFLEEELDFLGEFVAYHVTHRLENSLGDGDKNDGEDIDDSESTPVPEQAPILDPAPEVDTAVPVMDPAPLVSSVPVSSDQIEAAPIAQTPESTFRPSLERERAAFFLIKEAVTERNLQVAHYFDLERAERHLDVIDSIVKNPDYTEEKRERRIYQNLEALAAINERLTAALEASDIAPVSAAATADTSDPNLPAAAAAAVGVPSVSALAEQIRQVRGVDPLRAEVRGRLKAEYGSERAKSREAGKLFRESEQKYQQALKSFYENRSIFSKAAGGMRTLFGGEPKLPRELLDLQAVYKYNKAQYAEKLNEALLKRSGAIFGNVAYNEQSGSTKRAFANKFVLRPRQEQLAIQEKIFFEQAQNAKLKPVWEFLGKHKKVVRGVGLLTAAGLGAATGGLLGAGFGAARWAVGTAGGAALANFTYNKMKKYGEEAAQQLDNKIQNVAENFSLRDLEAIDEMLRQETLTLAQAKLQSRAVAIASAAAWGGAFGGVAGELGESISESWRSRMSADVDEVEESVKPNKPTNESASPEVIQASTRLAEIQQAVEDMKRAFANNMADFQAGRISAVPETDVLGGEALQAAMGETFMQVGRVELPQYNPDGSWRATVTVENVLVKGAATELLSDAQAKEMHMYLKMAISDVIADRPNITRVDLEKALFEKLQNVYAAEPWWKAANINQVTVGGIISESTPPVKIPEAANIRQMTEAPAIAEPIVPVEVYGYFEGQPQNVAESKTTKVEPIVPVEVSGYFEGQPVSVANAEQATKVAINKVPREEFIDGPEKVYEPVLPPENVPPQPLRKSGILNVGMMATEAESIPISIRTSDASFVPEVQAADYSEAPKLPEVFSASGNYLDTKEYRNFVEANIPGGLSGLNKMTDQAVRTFDNETYDFIERFTGSGEGYYASPYDVFSTMTVDQIENVSMQIQTGVEATLSDGTVLSREDFNQAGQMKYETYLAWMKKLDELKQTTDWKPTTRLSDLYMRSIAEAYLDKQANFKNRA